MTAWPFLFSRGYVLGYQFVVCPRVFGDERRMGAFRQLVGPLAAHPTSCREMIKSDDPVLGSVTLVYSSEPATVGGVPALDVSNRRVAMVWGVVFDEAESNNPAFRSRAEQFLNYQLCILSAIFERFWNSRTPTATILSDSIIDETKRTPSNSVKTEISRVDNQPPRQRFMVLLVSLTIASVLINILLLVQLSWRNEKLSAEKAIYTELAKKFDDANKELDALRVKLHAAGQ